MTSSLLVLFLLGICVGAGFAQDPRTVCTDFADCEETKYCVVTLENEPLCIDIGYRFGNCSFNARETCDEGTSCLETDDHHSYKCVCENADAVGDGVRVLKGGTGCQLQYKPCARDSDCPEYGSCDVDRLQCVCNDGFQGDGKTCEDIVDCPSPACDPNALCEDIPGSFRCACDGQRNYRGDGFTCKLTCSSDNDCDAPRAVCTDAQECECKPGYTGTGDVCEDINECLNDTLHDCSEGSNCVNNDGGYDCECKNGYFGEGGVCELLPLNCNGINNPVANQVYVIDPDGPGPAGQFQVVCGFIKGIVVTKVNPSSILPTDAGAGDTEIEVPYDPKPEDLKPLIDSSVYCYQDITFKCYKHFHMFPGTKWVDGFGNEHENWGSDIKYNCACGATKKCSGGCFCDGQQSNWLTTEEGRIVDKNRLPLVKMSFADSGARKGKLIVGPLVCAQEPVDLPTDCDDAKKNYGVSRNTPLYIDVDNNGPVPPMLVFCDVESYGHAGITEVSPNQNLIRPQSNDEVPFDYIVPGDSINALIEGSVFCSQQIEFTCMNSPLMGEDGGYLVGPTRRLDYFAGASSVQGKCGCGATKSCLDPEVECNCNVPGAGLQSDFGLIINKEDLPIIKVRANLNSGRGSYSIKPLRCSQAQFGIEPNCEKYRTGSPKDYTYFIDPDGPGNLEPFLVECKFRISPPLGETIVHHEDENQRNVAVTPFDIKYLQITPEQINALKQRSTFCTQEVKLNCNQLPLSGDDIKFIPANSTTPVDLVNLLSTCKDGGCNCDGTGRAEDSGILSDLALLPIGALDLANMQSGTSGLIEVGPMICSEVFPSCQALQRFLSSSLAVEGEGEAVNGLFTIDPDGAGGVEPFTVRCAFPTTIVDILGSSGGVEPTGPPIDKCFKVSYKSSLGEDISDAQINALVGKSGKCRQHLSLQCTNAPVSGNINFTSCDGTPQKGWGGSFGADKCACGVSGVCDGGQEANCNCDMNDDVTREDKGTIYDNSRLPVCEVCLTVTPKPGTEGNPSPVSKLTYTVGQLKCDGNPGTKGECQSARKVLPSNTQWGGKDTLEVPTTIGFSGKYVPVACKFYKGPIVGSLQVRPRITEYPPEADKTTNTTINYIFLRFNLIKNVLARNEYCRQKIFLFCLDGNDPLIGSDQGFFDSEGNANIEWHVLEPNGEDVTNACSQYSELCTRCGKPAGMLMTKKESLPVTTILLGNTGVTVVVDNLECFNVKKSCQHLLNTGRPEPWIVHNHYIIDPDGPLENFPFTVDCSFDKPQHNGVTVVAPDIEWIGSVTATGKNEPGQFKIPVNFPNATPKQIKSLTDISEFCWQGVKYECKESPLLDGGVNPDSYYSTYGQTAASPSFGTGALVDYAGCACGLLGTCTSPNVTCNCDAKGPMGVDQGVVSDKDKLPITSFSVGGQDPTSEASISLTPLRCGSKSTEPPRDCTQALRLGHKYGFDYSKSGEFLISPDPANVAPFMVRCDFDLYPGKALTIVKPNTDPNDPTPDPSVPYKVPYKGPSGEQVRALVLNAAYCYQGVKFDCNAAQLLKGGSFWTTAGTQARNYFWGGGEPTGAGHGVCACGKDELCGGLGSRDAQKARKCNCDVGDNVNRVDAGIITLKEYLPIGQFDFVTTAIEQNVNITIGDLICSDKPLLFNECDLGFVDCHPLAVCVDEDDGYRCVCKSGWRGRTTDPDPTLPRANGRECIDDDECSWNPCPYTANCTNTPGSFYCTCKEGYSQTSPLTCKDINECLDEALNDCDVHARCENLAGSYRCACKRGYRGDGKTCVPVGLCSCFGDPHCLSFDGRWLHFMGECQYIMAQDNCGGEPTFQVITNYWKRHYVRPGYYSWIKSVTILTEDLKITLDQGGEIFINGIKTQQFLTSTGLSVTKNQNKVVLRTSAGLEVKWDGIDGVDVTVPVSLKEKMCGLCGTFNDRPVDDWLVGPQCPNEVGQVTDNYHKFGNSWTDPTADQCVVDCDSPAPVYPTPCDNQILMDKECGNIFNKVSSPFRACLVLMGADEVTVMKDACAFDLCQEGDSFRVALCGIAEKLAEKCRVELNYIVIGWREGVSACDELECSNNLMYKTCGPVNPQTCLSSQVPDPMQSSDGDCVEGCFCAEGLLMDVDKCVAPNDCGCVYESRYLQKDEEIYTADCQFKVKCLGSNRIEKTGVSCGDNQECTLLDGVMACYCQEGYVMGPDGESCVPDKCGGVECNVTNQECNNGTCECKMGYIGDCNTCININECESGLANCNRIGQKCIDVEGSFTCECEAGFIPSEGGCEDFNECTLFSDTCGAHSKCSNTLGSYMCECCGGYKKNTQGECVRDPRLPVEGACCACQGDKCDDPGQMCGTDGVTYNNYRTLVVAACRIPENRDVKVNYFGKCHPSCETVVCKNKFAVCQMEGAIPKCNCPSCEDSSFTVISETICATNKVTYDSVCHMKAANCEAELETTVEVETVGKPCGKGTTPTVGPWGEWGDCSTKCQQGVKNRTRIVPDGSPLSSIATVPCFSTCTEGPCTSTTCTGPGQVCVVDGNEVPSCTCMDCTDYPEEMVCARLGNVIMTYASECELKAKACADNQPDYEVLEPRPCEDKPRECGLIRNYQRPVDENGCRSDESINLGLCYGGCDKNGEHCCYGDKTLEKQLTMRCPDRTFYRKMVQTITACNCLTNDQVQSLKMSMEVVP